MRWAIVVMALLATSASAAGETLVDPDNDVRPAPGLAVYLDGVIRPVWTPTATVVHTGRLDEVGTGAWIANRGSGYFLHRAFDGDRVAVLRRGGRFVDVALRPRLHPQSTICGVLEASAVSDTTVTDAPNPCRGTFGRLKAQRRAVGRRFNCPPHVCISGTLQTLLLPRVGCDGRFYANYIPRRSAYSFTLAGGETGFADDLGYAYGTVHYRFTTRDGRAAIVRDERYGWGAVQRGCIRGTPLGGPLKRPPGRPAAR